MSNIRDTWDRKKCLEIFHYYKNVKGVMSKIESNNLNWIVGEGLIYRIDCLQKSRWETQILYCSGRSGGCWSR